MSDHSFYLAELATALSNQSQCLMINDCIEKERKEEIMKERKGMLSSDMLNWK